MQVNTQQTEQTEYGQYEANGVKSKIENFNNKQSPFLKPRSSFASSFHLNETLEKQQSMHKPYMEYKSYDLMFSKELSEMIKLKEKLD